MESDKFTVSYEQRSFQCKPPKTFAELKRVICSELSIQQEELDGLSVFYLDEDNDSIVVHCEEDYRIAFDMLKHIHELRFTLSLKLSQSVSLSFDQGDNQLRSAMIFERGSEKKSEEEERNNNKKDEERIDIEKTVRMQKILHRKEAKDNFLIEKRKKIKAATEKIIDEEEEAKKKTETSYKANLAALHLLMKKLIQKRFAMFKETINDIPYDLNQVEPKKDDELQRKERRSKIINQIQQRGQEKVLIDSQIEAQQVYESKLKSVQDSFQIDLESRMQSFFEAEINKLKESIKVQCLSIQQEVMQNYMTHLSQIENPHQAEPPLAFSQFQPPLNRNQVFSIHNIDCDKCNIDPIIGIRFKCSQCEMYNLCEKCEEVNQSTKEHPHLFIIIREPLKIKEVKYAYAVIRNDIFHYKNTSSTVKALHVHSLALKNTGVATWSQAQLECDKEASDIVCNNNHIVNLRPKVQTLINVTLAIPENIIDGHYTCLVRVTIAGKVMTDRIKIAIVIERQGLYKKVEEFRKKFNVDKDSITDGAIIAALNKNQMDLDKAFESLFV